MRQRSSGRGNPRSAWLVVGLAAGLLLVAALQGRLGILVWLLAAGSLLVFTALYALGFRRRSWANLATLEQRKFALSLGAVVLVLGMVAGIVSTPEPGRTPLSSDAEGLRPRPDLFALPTTPMTPPPGSILRRAQQPAADQATDEPGAGSDGYALLGDTSGWEPTEADDSLANKPCEEPGEARTQRQTEYRCTHTTDGRLVWIERSGAERLAEEWAAAETARAQEQAREAQREQDMAEQRAAEERAREAAQTVPPANPPANQPQPAPSDPPTEPPNRPPTTPPTEPPTERPAEPPTEPTTPPTDPPTRPPNPDPTTPPTVPPTLPGQPDRPDPLAPDPDIPVLPPEFPVPPAPQPPQRPAPSSSFAPHSSPDASQAAVDVALSAVR
ncbi:hypothetical protein N2K95_03515 [Arthrobacter zhaoxinii]|uniref:Uncharacterized protein n=1 Tax=Arthrobacter zhaoxinii TaxID=2964616 RepID=A0ABY5YRQ1_9MICC|nr:hypothetical protein [Arthrobacter zhaoxinii]UWX97765.1 hypothetical protein N2K95_03515 [Arthrobacter zhaoxinii]